MAVDSGVGCSDGEAETMEELLAGIEREESALRPLRTGEVVEGVVASVSGDEALVDLGDRSAGVLSLREASGEGTDVAVGDRVVAAVVQPEGPDGRAILSTRRARSRREWTRMTELKKTGEVVEAEVVEANRGGLVVDIGLRGFVPLSQLASVGNLGAAERSAVPNALRDYVGKRLPLKVIEADQRRDRLILSEKGAAQQLRRWAETVRVLVTGVDRKRGRISLSIKRLEEDPWRRAPCELAVGTDLDATVTRVMPYGAFARVPMGVEGLIHISELAPRRISSPTEVVQSGDLVRVRVVAIDPDRRRLPLSVRQAAGNVVYATRTDQDANV